MEQWYSIIEYARKFNISDMTVRRRIKTGKIKAVLKEGKYYIPVNDSNSNFNSVSSQRELEPSLESSNFRKDSSLSKALSANPVVTKNSSINNEHINLEKDNNLSLQKSRLPGFTTPSLKMNYSNSTSNNFNSNSLEKNSSSISQNLKLQGKTPDTNTLLLNYNNMLQQFRRFEKILENSYNSKILQLESELKIQKIENSNLKQQLEDLQVLIKLLEKK